MCVSYTLTVSDFTSMEVFVCPLCGEELSGIVWDHDAGAWVRDCDGMICYLTEDSVVCLVLPEQPYEVAIVEEVHVHR